MSAALSSGKSSGLFLDCDSMNDGTRFWITSARPAESTPAMPGEKYASQTRHRSVFRWIRVLPVQKKQDQRNVGEINLSYCLGKQDTPSISPSSYEGLNADISAERWLAIDACVCLFVNVGSYASSFCSMTCNCARSSSSSDEGAAVFCEKQGNRK